MFKTNNNCINSVVIIAHLFTKLQQIPITDYASAQWRHLLPALNDTTKE